MTAGTNGTSTRRNGVGPGFATLCDSVVQLAKAMPAPLQRISLRVGEWAVDVEFAAPVTTPSVAMLPAVGGAAAFGSLPAGQESTAVEAGTLVRSELVGTFFAAPGPDAEPFVRIGDLVDDGQQLGIVEAMKLMNPLSAPCSGTVRQIHVSDGDSVEYDQPLFTLEPTGTPS